MFENCSEMHVVYFNDGKTWERVENCTIVFRAIYDESQNLALPGEDSVAIKLDELIPLALQQVQRNKAIKIYQSPTSPIP